VLNKCTKFGTKNCQALPSNVILRVGSFYLAAPCRVGYKTRSTIL